MTSPDRDRNQSPHGLGNESGDARQQQPLSKIKPVYLLSAVAVAIVIAVVFIIITITKT